MLKKTRHFITRLGIDESIDSREARRISYVNYIALLSLLYLVIRILLSISNPAYALKLSGMSLFAVLVLVCNAYHFHTTAKFLIFTVWVTGVSFFSYFYLGGFYGGTFVVLFSAVLWPFMLFNPVRKKYIFICLGYLTFCFSLLIILQYVYPRPVSVDLNMDVVRVSTTVLTVAFLLLLSWYFHSSNISAEEKLRFNAHQMQLITDNSPAYIAYVGADDLCYRFVNKRFEKSYNKPRDQIVGKHIKEIISEKNYQFALPFIEKVRSGQPASYENVFPVKGEDRWIKVNYVPDFDKKGVVDGIVVMSLDITDQKVVEEQLRQSEKQFRSLFENMIEGVAIHELIFDDQGKPFDYRILNVNPMFERHTGLSSVNAVGLRASEIYGTGEPPYFKVYSRVAQTGEPEEMEVYFEPMNKYFHISVFSPGSNQFVTVFENITERKLAQQEMQRSNEYLENVLENSPDGIGIVDSDGQFFKWNRAAAELYGFSYEELEGKSFGDFYPDERKLEEMLYQLRQDGFIRKYEIDMRKKDGSIVPFELSISLLKDEDKETIGSVCLARDLSETKKTLSELREAYEELQVAKEAAETANKAKSTFLANMSHELRTPLNAILGFSELMKRDPAVSGKQKNNLETIGRSGEHLLSLINDVLEFSKIEAGQMQVNEDSFDLHLLLLGLEEMFRLRAEQKGLSLELYRSKDVPQFIRSDKNKLRQILINLLGNAIQYTSSGGIRLSVTATKEEEEINPSKLSLHFDIADTGVGITDEAREKIFDAFFQVGDHRASGQGTGLGLPISRKFAEVMGGELQVQSEVGKGTQFILTLTVEGTDSADAEPSDSNRKVIGLAGGQSAFRILVVEDNENSRTLLTTLLRTIGFNVEEAVNGQEAVEKWRQYDPHLIWMDIRMPVMDGCEATEIIKTEMEGTESDTKIIALTASAFEEDRVRVFECGGDDFVRKPFRESEVFGKMHKHLGVQYVFAKEEMDKMPSEALLKSHENLRTAIEALPESIVNKLITATELSDTKIIDQAIDEIRELNTELADALNGLAEEFSYDQILNLIRRE